MFDKKDMVDWEDKPIFIQDNYIEAKLYFKQHVKDFKTYTKKRGITSAKQDYKSANMAVYINNELQKYIQGIARAVAASNERQSGWAVNISEETKAKDAQVLAITAQIKTLFCAFAALTKSMSNKENIPPRQATQSQAIPNACSIGCATWEITADHMAITQLASNTIAAHALRKKMDTRMM
jgi:hypothetical protein